MLKKKSPDGLLRETFFHRILAHLKPLNPIKKFLFRY